MANNFKIYSKYYSVRFLYIILCTLVLFLLRNQILNFLYSISISMHILTFLSFILFWIFIEHSVGIQIANFNIHLFPLHFNIILIQFLFTILTIYSSSSGFNLSKLFLSKEKLLISVFFENLSAFFIIYLYYLLSFIINKDERKNNSNTKTTKNTKEPTPKEIKEWILNDDPIEEENSPFCTIKSTVDQTINHLQETKLKNIGIVGSFGSGKSSVIKTVRKKVESENKIFCIVDTWGREIEKLDEQIIGLLINSLKNYIDVSDLIFTPEKYAVAMKESHWLIRTMNSFNTGRYDSQNIICKIDQILKLNKKQLVVCIEDFARNNFNNDKNPPNVYSLLNKFKLCDNIALILTINTKTDDSNDLSKVCDYTLGIIPLQKEFVLKTLLIFRDFCLKNYVISEYTYKSDLAVNYDPLYIDDLTTHFVKENIFENIQKLCENIRIFKKSLAKTLISWKLLHGEVNFYDLLFINIIHYNRPDIFYQVVSNYSKLVAFERNEFFTSEKKGKNDEKNDNFNEISILLDQILPNRNGSQKQIDIMSQKIAIPHHGVVYWNRILNGVILEDEIRDLDYISHIEKKINNNLQTIPFIEKTINEDAYFEQFLKFNKLIDLSILHDIFNYIILNKNESLFSPSYNNDSKIIKILKNRIMSENGNEYDTLGFETIDKFSKNNLNFCNLFFENWFDISYYPKYLDILKKNWNNNPNNFINAEKSDYYSLQYLIFVLSNEYLKNSHKINNIDTIEISKAGPYPIYYIPTLFDWLKPLIMKSLSLNYEESLLLLINLFFYEEKNKIQIYNELGIEIFKKENDWMKILSDIYWFIKQINVYENISIFDNLLNEIEKIFNSNNRDTSQFI